MEVAKNKRQQPKVSEALEVVPLSIIDDADDYIEKVQFNGGFFTGREERLQFDDVVFKQVRFTGAELRGAEFVDVIFDTCDLSNANLSNATFHRCMFKNVKLTGTNFSSAAVGHVLFENCEGAYSNFNFSSFKETDFVETDLSSSDFYECKLKGFRLSKCQLDDASFAETNLAQIDLSTSTYDKIEVTVDKIRGCIVSKEQAIRFAQVLGLKIKE